MVMPRALFLHVSLPGQVNGAEDLPSDFIFPSMEVILALTICNAGSYLCLVQAIGLNLITVMDHLSIKQVVGLGDGAGANIILRFAMNHPSRVHGVLAINTEGVGSGGYKEIIMVNTNNRLIFSFL